MRFLFFILGFVIYLSSTSFAQSKKIQILDKGTHDPIPGITFRYGQQFGITNTLGQFDFIPNSKDTLRLSHISYGEWDLYDVILKKAISSGKIIRKEQSVTLQPVTVIHLRKSQNPSEEKKLDHQDKLAHDVSLILNQSPVIQSIRKSGSTGFDPVLRGFKRDQLNIVIDGIQSATVACPNRMDPPTTQVAPNMTQQVEILKGPHSLRYGTALGGTINFISAEPQFSTETKTFGRWSGGYETNGNIFRTEALAGISNKNNNLSLFGSWSKGDDYADGDGIKIPAKFRRLSFGAQYAHKVSKRNTVFATINHNFTKDAEFPALPMDLRKDDSWMFQLKHNYKNPSSTLNSWKNAFYYTYIDHFMDNRLKNFSKRLLYAETSVNTNNYGGRSEAKWVFRKNIIYTGIDFKGEEANGTRKRDFIAGPMSGKVFYDNVWQNSVISNTGAFAEYHIIKESFRWVFSGRLALNQARNRDAAPEFIKIHPRKNIVQWNPSVSAGIVKKLANKTNISLWVSRVQRSGSLSERYINFFPIGLDPYELVGNPNIKQEANYQADINFSLNHEKTRLDFGVYTSYVYNYITSEVNEELKPRLPSSPGVRVFSNLDWAFLTGFEFSWSQKLFPQINHQLSIAYTYGEDTKHHEPLPEIAPMDMRSSFKGEFINGHLHPSISFRYVLPQRRISKIFGERKTPDFALIDLELSYKFWNIFNTSFGIQNILDKAYYEHLTRSVRGQNRAIYAPGRNFYLSITVDLR